MPSTLQIIRDHAERERRLTIDPHHEEPPRGDLPWHDDPLDDPDLDANHAWADIVMILIAGCFIFAFGAAAFGAFLEW
jgi:hypothetical protein